MKRYLTVTAAAVAAALLACGCGSDREGMLKVYNWGDYIDEDLLPEFEEWYKEQTGEDIEVVYQTFDINETMLSKIEKGHEDYDVVCPSDYIIERMIRNDLVIPISHDFGDTPDYTQNVAPYIMSCVDKIDGFGRNPRDYAIPYMWGTVGFLYNEKYVDASELSSWGAIKNDKFIDRIFIKDASRDVYSVMQIYLRHQDVVDGKITLDELMYDASDEAISAVEEYMSDMRYRVAGWEADFGKEQMTQERGWVSLCWSGDAVWAITEAEEVGVPLNYIIPDEGSNVWLDGWVIPKYAKNVKAASYFINFLCRPDVAIRNMDYIGYVSAVGTPEVLEQMSSEEDYPETVDVSYFFGEDAVAEHLNPSMYFDKSVIDRCTMMHDWADQAPALLTMWARVKGNQLTGWTIFVIIATVMLISAAEIMKLIRRKRRASHRKKIKR